MTVRVVLPAQLRTLARVAGEVEVELAGAPTQRALLDALEAAHPTLRGTIRDHATRERRSHLRFFACGEDFSFAAPDDPLPAPVAEGREPFLVVGAISGG